MEEEIITPEEVVFDYHKLRYILDKNGYLCHASLGGLIICDLGECTEYNGDIPEGYETIEEWHDKEIERLNAWKVVDGNLVFDASRDYKLKIKYEQENNDNSPITRKELGMASTEEINPYTDLFPSHKTSGGYIVGVDEKFNRVGNLPTEEVNLSVLKEQDLDFIELEFIGNNFLPNTATSSVNNGIEYTQNKDKTINVSGTATDRSTLNLAGTDTSVRNILTFKADTSYLLGGLEGLSLEFYKYDGSDRTLIGTYKDGIISFEEDVNVTQVVLVVDKGTSIDTTIKPMLQLVGLEYPVIQMKKYNKDLFNLEKATSGYLADDTGEIVTGGNNEKTSDFISVKGKSFITCLLSVTVPTSGYIWWGYLFYDGNKTAIGTRQSVHNANNEFKITIPTNAKYIRISTRFYNDGVLSIKDNREGQYYTEGISTQVTRGGKNLFNKLKYKVTNGTLEFDISKLVEGKTYTISSNLPITNIKISNTRSGYTSVAANKVFTTFTFTMTRNANISSNKIQYLYIVLNSGTWVSDISELDGYNIQIEEGTTETEFEEFGVSPSPESPSEIINVYKAGTYNLIADNNIYTITLPDDLRSASNGIADTLWADVNSDNGIEIEKKVNVVVIDGDETVELYTYNGMNGIQISNVLSENSTRAVGMSNRSLQVGEYVSSNSIWCGVGSKSIYWIGILDELGLSTTDEFKTWLSQNNLIVQYDLTTYKTSYIPSYSYNEYGYEEYKNNTTLIDLAGNKLTIPDEIIIKNNQIILIKENGEEIYLGDTVMPRTYTPYTNAYCHQKVFLSFKYKDPRNVDITKINLKGLISVTDVETEYNFTNDDLTKIQNYIMETGTLTEEEIELYDVNGDGVISASDYVLIRNMINGVISNKITGTFEINTTQSKRVLVLRDSEGKILTSLGLNGATTPSLSTEQIILGGIEQPKIMSGTSLPEEVTDGAVFLLYDE